MRQKNSKLATFLSKNVGNLLVWMVIGYFGWVVVTAFIAILNDFLYLEQS